MPSDKTYDQFYEEHARSVIRYLGCLCEHFPRGAELDIVKSAYQSAFNERESGGFTPLLIVLESHMFFEDGESSAELQKKVFAAPQFDCEEWFVKKKNEHDRDYCYEPDQIIGEITGGEAINDFAGIVDYGIKKSWECVLAKIPVKNPWEVFAWFPFGGWNDCPPPEEMLWIGKYWYEKYGAVPAVMTGSELEFTARPVEDRSEAFKLAVEHFAFCPDHVLQNTETIGKLADSLMKSSVWHFWWD